MNESLVVYSQPEEMPRAEGVRVTVEGRNVPVLSTRDVNFVVFAFHGKVRVQVEFGPGSEPDDQALRLHVEEPSVCPLSRGIPVALEDDTACFELPEPRSVSLEIPGRKILYLFAAELIVDPPDPDSDDVVYFAAGQVHSDAKVVLKSNQTLFLEGGAVLCGRVWTEGAENVRIAGHGIMDMSRLPDRGRSVLFTECRDVEVSGITMLDSKGWNIMLHRCTRAVVRGVKQIGLEVTSDGVDVVASEDVLVDDCFLHNNDDCIAVKCFQNALYKAADDPRNPVAVRRVTVQNSVLCNTHSGNVMEIGYELRGSVIEDVTFRNCDVLGSHSIGGTFTIHNGDRAVVRNILYEDIRVEHMYSRFVDFRILLSRYSRDEERGQIQNVTLRNIAFPIDIHNSISLIGGHDEAHMVKGVHFEDVYVGENKVTHPDALNMYVKYSESITFQ
jgi:Glycosyl hydrolases family 28